MLFDKIVAMAIFKFINGIKRANDDDWESRSVGAVLT